MRVLSSNKIIPPDQKMKLVKFTAASAIAAKVLG
jgi:hypothetical protein